MSYMRVIVAMQMGFVHMRSRLVSLMFPLLCRVCICFLLY